MGRPSRAYEQCLNDCKRHHQSSKTFSGKLLRPHAPFIKAIIDRHNCRSILDYGCGKGEQYRWVSHGEGASIPGGMTIEQFWGIPVTKYDPAYEPFSEKPQGKFDLVICTHTLGSIPVQDLQWIIDELYGFANKALYVAEKIGPIKKHAIERRSLCPVNWQAEDWARVLKRDSHVECTLAARNKTENGVIVKRVIV